MHDQVRNYLDSVVPPLMSMVTLVLCPLLCVVWFLRDPCSLACLRTRALPAAFGSLVPMRSLARVLLFALPACARRGAWPLRSLSCSARLLSRACSCRLTAHSWATPTCARARPRCRRCSSSPRSGPDPIRSTAVAQIPSYRAFSAAAPAERRSLPLSALHRDRRSRRPAHCTDRSLHLMFLACLRVPAAPARGHGAGCLSRPAVSSLPNAATGCCRVRCDVRAAAAVRDVCEGCRCAMCHILLSLNGRPPCARPRSLG